MNWNIFKKADSVENLLFFEVIFSDDLIFGVTAASGQEAEELVCEEVFHDQTIPGFPVVKELTLKEIKKKYSKVSFKKVQEKGIWYISS